MKILAIDIGAGTQDILVYDSSKNIENCITLVLPTPSKYLAERIRRMECNLYIRGDTIGGGSITRAILEHIKKGYRVVMEREAAYSIRNDLDEVRSMGIEVGTRHELDGFHDFEITEIDLPKFKDFLSHFGENLDVDVIAIAVQDHGVAPKGISDRIFRFEKTVEMLKRDNRAESFHFTEESVPGYYLRMKSAVAAAKRASSSPVIVMDTAFSAILGCLEELRGPSLIVNVGNGHTVAAIVVEGRILGIYEHHTHKLTPEMLESDLRRFVKGQLSSQEVYEADGHGAYTLEAFEEDFSVLVTGPNRTIFTGTSFRFTYAAPGGNTMMTGPLGLVRAARRWLSVGS